MRSNEEIKKGLECCFDGRSCTLCPYSDGERSAMCDDHLGKDALELIKAQERRIEEFEAENENEKRKNKITLYCEVDEEQLDKTARRVYEKIKDVADRGIKDATEREGAKNED